MTKSRRPIPKKFSTSGDDCGSDVRLYSEFQIRLNAPSMKAKSPEDGARAHKAAEQTAAAIYSPTLKVPKNLSIETLGRERTTNKWRCLQSSWIL